MVEVVGSSPSAPTMRCKKALLLDWSWAFFFYTMQGSVGDSPTLLEMWATRPVDVNEGGSPRLM